jgi:predicted amidohydrolase
VLPDKPDLIVLPEACDRPAGMSMEIQFRYFKAGKEAPVFQCDFGRIACAVCFDLNFDELGEEIPIQVNNENIDIPIGNRRYIQFNLTQEEVVNLFSQAIFLKT